MSFIWWIFWDIFRFLSTYLTIAISNLPKTSQKRSGECKIDNQFSLNLLKWKKNEPKQFWPIQGAFDIVHQEIS